MPLLHERGTAVYVRSPIPVGWLAPRGWTDAGLALALGYVLYRFLDTLAYLAVDVVAQQFVDLPTHFGESAASQGLLNGLPVVPAVDQLTFDLGGTRFAYGVLVVEALALVLIALAGLALWRWRLRRLDECPHCRSQIPRDATVCRECSLDVAG